MPIGTMIPVSSAISMNSPGATMPRTGCAHRRSASSATRSPDREVELRLEQHTELVALERLAESPLGEEASHRLCVHRLVEQLVPRTAAALRAVHRGVRVAQEARGTVRGPSRDRDADARGDHDLGVLEREGLTERADRAVGELFDLTLVGEVFADDDELVTSESRHGVVAADRSSRAGARPRRATRRRCRGRARR